MYQNSSAVLSFPPPPISLCLYTCATLINEPKYIYLYPQFGARFGVEKVLLEKVSEEGYVAYIGGTFHVSVIKAYAIIMTTNTKEMAYSRWHKQPQIEHKLGTT